LRYCALENVIVLINLTRPTCDAYTDGGARARGAHSRGTSVRLVAQGAQRQFTPGVGGFLNVLR